MTIYKNDFDRLLDSSLSRTDYARTVDEMTTIYTTSSVAEAEAAFEASLDALARSNATYYRLDRGYDVAFAKATRLAPKAPKSKRQLGVAIFGGVMSFFGKLGKRRRRQARISEQQRKADEMKSQAAALQRMIQAELNVKLNKLATSMVLVASVVEDLDRFIVISEEITDHLVNRDYEYDYGKYTDDITFTANMKVRWDFAI